MLKLVIPVALLVIAAAAIVIVRNRRLGKRSRRRSRHSLINLTDLGTPERPDARPNDRTN